MLPADFVTAERRNRPGAHRDRVRRGRLPARRAEGLTVVNPVRLDGTYDERIGPYAGRWVKDADEDLIEDLRARGKLLRAEEYEHSYPHCWRCGTPLLYYAKPSWYIATSQIKDRLLAANETVNWHPEHVKHGRFGTGWRATSTGRCRASATGARRCRCGAARRAACARSGLRGAARAVGREADDPHRPFVDEVTFPCENCGGAMRRVPEVIDVWFDSGSMPFAQFHAPHENSEHFEQRFPADFICEALDQTRGWFYSLLAISTLLFDRSSYRNGLPGPDPRRGGPQDVQVPGQHGEPWDVIDRYGADALRWYFFTSKLPWDGYRFSMETIGEGVRHCLLQLWNTSLSTCSMPTPDADHDRDALTETSNRSRPLGPVTGAGDRGGGARADGRLRRHHRRARDPGVRRQLSNGTCAAPAGGSGTETRPRSDAADMSGHGGQAGAPFTPSLRTRSRQPRRHRAERPPVRLSRPRRARPELEHAMAVARETVRLGLAARAQAKLKVRQPLRAAVVVATGREREAIERLRSWSATS